MTGAKQTTDKIGGGKKRCILNISIFCLVDLQQKCLQASLSVYHNYEFIIKLNAPLSPRSRGPLGGN